MNVTQVYRTIAEFLILLDLGSKKNVSWPIKGTFSADKTHSCGVVSVNQHTKWQAVSNARVYLQKVQDLVVSLEDNYGRSLC